MDDIKEIKENLAKMPKFITENEDGTYTIKLKKETLIPDGEVIMQELNGDAIESCTKLGEATKKEMEVLLARRSCTKPKLSDEDFSKLKGSNYMKLKYATIIVYGLNDFL